LVSKSCWLLFEVKCHHDMTLADFCRLYWGGSLFVAHYEDGIRFVSGTERFYGRGSTRALHLRQRNQNREQVQTQGVLHLHLKQRLWTKCLGWQKSGVNFPGILPRVKHCVREVEWTFVVDIGFQRAFVGSMF
jgi:hypothetical protein